MAKQLSYFNECIVKVLASSMGTASWIGSHHLLTCFHVIENSIQPIQICFRTEGKEVVLPVKVVKEAHRPIDLAVLEVLEEAPLHPWLLFSQSLPTDLSAASFYSRGFGGTSRLPSFIYNLKFSGSKPYVPGVYNYTLAERKIIGGFSGAPVGHDEAPDALGILRSSFSSHQPQGGTVIPAELIRNFAESFLATSPPIFGKRPAPLLKSILDEWQSPSLDLASPSNRKAIQSDVRNFFRSQSSFPLALNSFLYLKRWEEQNYHLKEQGLFFYRGSKDKMVLSKVESLGKAKPNGVRVLLDKIGLREVLERSLWTNILVGGADPEQFLLVLPDVLKVLDQKPPKIKEKIGLKLVELEELGHASTVSDLFPESSYRGHYLNAEIALKQGKYQLALEQNLTVESSSQQGRSQPKMKLQYIKIVAYGFAEFNAETHRKALEIATNLLERGLEPGGQRYKWDRVKLFFLSLKFNLIEIEQIGREIQEMRRDGRFKRPLVSKRVLKKVLKFTVAKEKIKEIKKAIAGLGH